MSVIRIAAFNGTMAAIRDNPETKPQFRDVANQLRALEAEPCVDLVDVVILIQTLPIEELQSDTARIVLVNSTFLLEEYGAQTDLSDLEAHAIVTAFRTGIERAIGPP